MERRGIEQLLGEVQGRISRVEPGEAHEAMNAGAVLIDTRSGDYQDVEGRIPGALELPLSVLEWRVDPSAPTYDERVGGLDQQVIVICRHGFSSSFAVERMQALGFTNVADVIGGFEAWRDAGLPVTDNC